MTTEMTTIIRDLEAATSQQATLVDQRDAADGEVLDLVNQQLAAVLDRIDDLLKAKTALILAGEDDGWEMPDCNLTRGVCLDCNRQFRVRHPKGGCDGGDGQDGGPICHYCYQCANCRPCRYCACYGCADHNTRYCQGYEPARR